MTDDDRGDAARQYVYVGTDGTVRALNLPHKAVPGTDAQADRFAYVTRAGDSWRIHVVKASTGRELTTVDVVADYTWAGWDVPPVGISGDYVVLGVDKGQRVLDWRTGKCEPDVPGAQLPSVGGGQALGGKLSAEVYRLGDSRAVRSVRDLALPDASGGHPWADNELSPDGRFVQTINTFVTVDGAGEVTEVSKPDGKVVRHPVVYVTEVASGRRITLPGHSKTYGWTPDGRLVRVDGTTITTCDGSTGNCTSREVPAGPGTVRMAGRYLGS